MRYMNKQAMPDEAREGMRKMWSDEDFNKELRELVDMEVKGIDEGKADGVTPKMVVVCSKDGKIGGELERAIVVMMVNDEFNDHDKRMQIFGGLGAKFADEGFNVLSIYQISEAWMSTQVAKDAKGEYLPPSQDPNRTECIIIAGMTIDGRNNMASVPFQRVGVNDKKVIFAKSPVYMDFKDDKSETEAYLLQSFFQKYLEVTMMKLLKKKGIDPLELMKQRARSMRGQDAQTDPKKVN